MTDVTQQPFAIDASSQFPTSNRAPRTDEAFAMLLGALTNGGGRGRAVDDLVARYHESTAAGDRLPVLLRPKVQASINEADGGLMTTSLIEALLGDTGQAVFTAQDGQQYAHDTPEGRTYKQLHGSNPEFWEAIVENNVYFADPARDGNDFIERQPAYQLELYAIRQLLTNRTGM